MICSMENEFKSPEIIELLKQKLKNNSTLMLSIAESMRVAVLKNFETEGGRIKPWQRLAHKTIEQRKNKGYWPGKILQRTGQLKRSIISSAGDDYAQVSTNLIYAAIHNYGGVIHRSSIKTYIRKKSEGKTAKKPATNKMSSIRIPARPFMMLSDRDIENLKRKVLKYISGN